MEIWIATNWENAQTDWRALKLLEALRVPVTIGTMRAGMDGRAEVCYAVTRIASELDKGSKPKRSLASYLEESDGR